MANHIDVSELDFEQIRIKLTNFLKTQERFKDYDFEGSNLAIILDLLAYNTQYNALYESLGINESFLNAARKRDNVVSRAGDLGYLPRSAVSSRVKKTLVINDITPTGSNLILPEYSTITATLDGISYNFYSIESVVSVVEGGKYKFKDVNFVEGIPVKNTFVHDGVSKILIKNKDADLTTLKVTVQESVTNTSFEVFHLNKSIVENTPDSNVYYMKEIYDGLYEITFGDNIVSKAITSGNVIVLNYFVSSKAAANGARNFIYTGQELISGGSVEIMIDGTSFGGDEPEDIETVRFYAPREFAAQNRAVIVDDYETLIKTKMSNVASVNVWGGEDNVPPVYGKVFVSVKPKDSDYLTTQDKEYISGNILSKRGMLGIFPEMVDPSYVDLIINVSVNYNPYKTSLQPNDLRSKVFIAINDYTDNKLEKFDTVFRQSQFTSLIDTTDVSFVSSLIDVKARISLEPKINIVGSYVVKFFNPISNNKTTNFFTNGFLINGSDEVHYLDDFGGKVRLYVLDSMKNKITKGSIGTVDYDKGIISVSGLNIKNVVESSTLDFTITPKINDIISSNNQMVRVSKPDLVVNLTIDKIASGYIQAGVQ